MELSIILLGFCNSPEEGSKEDYWDKEFLTRTFFARRDELKVGKLEIYSLYLCEKIPRNIGVLGISISDNVVNKQRKRCRALKRFKSFELEKIYYDLS